jgi:acyl-CoA thioesterase
MPASPPPVTAEGAAQATAEKVRAAMIPRDAALRLLGLRVGAVGPGLATVQMTVRADMLNGFGICQGGLVCALADTAFAYACNAYDELTVAAGFEIDLLAPSHEGDVLTASAQQVSRSGRLGLYDVAVCNQTGAQVAVFRGRSYTMKGRRVTGSQTL